MASILDGKIEVILEDILEGKTFREIAAEHECALGTLHRYLNLDEHSARVSNALAISASSYADKAEEVLLSSPNDKGELMRARELAQHYRWKAGKRNPKKYGESSLLKLADNEGGKLYSIFATDPLQAHDSASEDSEP